MKNLKRYIEENVSELYRLHYDLCHIPAPSWHEDERAKYCLDWFWANGIDGAYIDEALNVIVPYQIENRDKITAFVAHTDTVFPDTEPMPYRDDGERIYCPGAGDDTASVCVLMLTAKYFFENKIDTHGVLFVCNSGEEGLGNLKGTRAIFSKFGDKITKFISFDSFDLNSASDRCVGSHRYEVEVLTEGGHSWVKFGNKNAIAELSKIINAIYSVNLPKKEGKRVSYNVGEISGGTSVNTIAQSAKMFCEYRSDDEELLNFMKTEFERIFREARSDGVEINVKKIGDRPCAAKIDEEKMAELKRKIETTVTEITKKPISYRSSSTDCNIPLSLGIPALTVGVLSGAGMHTREEYVIKSSLPVGLEIGIKLALEITK